MAIKRGKKRTCRTHGYAYAKKRASHKRKKAKKSTSKAKKLEIRLHFKHHY